MRRMLDGQAGFSRLDPVEQHVHKAKVMFWDFLQRTNPHEYERHAKAQGKKNSQQLLASLRAHDPLFEPTWGMLKHMMEMLPDTAEYLVKKGTHDDPARFMELYEEMREWAQEAQHRKHRRKHAQARAKAAHVQGLARHEAQAGRTQPVQAEENDPYKYLEFVMPGNAGGR